MDRSYVPPQGQVLTAYICCRDAKRAIEWYRDVLGARLAQEPFLDPDGRIGHAELEIDSAVLMLADAAPEEQFVPGDQGAPSAYVLNLYVPDVDAVVAAAERAGATVDRAPVDEFFGSRVATVSDPFGVRWMFGTHQRTASDEEISSARTAYAGDSGSSPS